VPHPTPLVKLVRRAGPEVIEQLDNALVAFTKGGWVLPQVSGDAHLAARRHDDDEGTTAW
jgi:hypothetical protein